VERIDPSETKSLRLFLSEVGARLSDVFGADDILWVEGRTEELAFPAIVRKVLGRQLYGTEIIGVRNTGDLEGKQSQTVFEIYQRLSHGRGLLPPAVGFVFDREGRSETERQDLERQSGGTVHFTRRRMFENYLLNPAAIAAVASSIDGFREDDAVTEEEVSHWLDTNRWEKQYHGKKTVPTGQHSEEYWLENAHGADVLAAIFRDPEPVKLFETPAVRIY
jgi:hypothetical protein